MEPTLTVQACHQCSSLDLVKLDAFDFLLWVSHIFPLVQSLGIHHHLIKAEPPNEFLEDDINPDHDTCVSNDGLLTTWLLSIMSNEIFGYQCRYWKCFPSMESMLKINSYHQPKSKNIFSRTSWHLSRKGPCPSRNIKENLNKLRQLSNHLCPRFKCW